MAKPYSNDLRARVVAAVEEGATRAEAAERHDLSLSSVGRSSGSNAKQAASVRRSSAGTNRMPWRRMSSGSGNWWHSSRISRWRNSRPNWRSPRSRSAKLKATLRKIAAYTLKGAAYSIKSLCKTIASRLDEISRAEYAAYLANSAYGQPKRKTL